MSRREVSALQEAALQVMIWNCPSSLECFASKTQPDGSVLFWRRGDDLRGHLLGAHCGCSRPWHGAAGLRSMQMEVNNSTFPPFWKTFAGCGRWRHAGCVRTLLQMAVRAEETSTTPRFLYQYNYLFWACRIFLACLPEEIKLI